MDFSQQESDIKRRRRLAGALQGTAMNSPQGQMVSGHYVAPNVTQHLATLLSAYGSRKNAETADTMEGDLKKKKREALANVLSGKPGDDFQSKANYFSQVQELNPDLASGIGGALFKDSGAGDGMFDGSGIEAQALNRYLNSLPPEQREAAANELAQQRLSRPTTISTPEGTTVLPGYSLPGAQAPKEVPKATTDNERLASGFAERMGASEKIFSDLSAAGFDPANMKDASATALPGIAEAAITSPEFKSYKAAAADWITANLRKESGATITPVEFETDFKKYFPQPFDPPEVQAQKAEARKLAEQNVRFSAGRATQERAGGAAPQIPQGPKPGEVQDGFRFKGGNPSDPNSWEPA